MGSSLIVFTRFAETDNSIDVEFDANGQHFVFSPRKANRMTFTDSETARQLSAAYPGAFTIWASYEGPIVAQESVGDVSLDDVAAVLTNCVTLEATRNAYESFRQFYPTLKMYVVDNGSNDASTEYVKSLASEFTTTVVNPYNYGHGPAMHQVAGIASAEGYKFLLTLDSDTITLRGGIVETMLGKLGNGYAVGKAYQTDENGFVSNSQRGVTYIHPSVALFNLNQYAMLRPFILHGAPCISNMIDANLRGFYLADFDTEEYIHHLGTVTVQAVHITDVNMAFLFAQHPPLVSFVVRYSSADNFKRCVDSILRQTDADYEIVPITGLEMLAVERNVITRIRGLYMYLIDDTSVIVDDRLVETVREIACDNLCPNVIVVQSADKLGNIRPLEWHNEEVLDYRHLIERRELWMTSTISYSGRWNEAATVKDSFSRDDWPKRYWLDRVVIHG